METIARPMRLSDMKIRVLVLSVVLTTLALSTLSLGAQTPAPAMPDTPATRQFAAWLAAFNSGDRATMLAYQQQNNPSGVDRIDNTMAFRAQTGGFEFKKAEESTATKFSGIVKERNSDQFAQFTIEVEAAEPHKVVDLNMGAIPTPAEFAPAKLSQADALAALRAEMEKNAAADRFAGAAMVVKDGKPVFSAAYGMADRERKTADKLNTQFRIGSMNKMFTATSILQLVQAGKINLTDPIGKILTDYPNQDVATKVTV